MTKRLFLPVLVSAVMGWAASSCNSSDDPTEYEYVASSSVLVSGFSLSDDTKVLDSLSNVFFSINLEEAKIFNADSLPFGTKVSKLVPVINTPENAKAVTLEFPRENASDSIVDYLKNSTDSIDFSLGPVKLRVTSESGSVERVYEVKVNVHQVKPDTLAWGAFEMGTYPVSPAVKDSKAVYADGIADGPFVNVSELEDGRYCTILSDDPAFGGSGSSYVYSLPWKADVSSLCAVASSLYMLSDDGTLYKSESGSDWASTGASMSHVYGAYGDQLIGCAQDSDGAYAIAAYPSGERWAMPDGFPVKGTSAPIVYTTPMGFAPQMIMTGGIMADGACTGATWGFDGYDWAKISYRDIPKNLQGMTVVEYDLFNVPNTTWRPEQFPAILAFGGHNESEANRTVYYSRDWGLTWAEAPELLQLPAEVPSISGASAIVYKTTMHISRGSQEWMPLAFKRIPPHCALVQPSGSRVEKPVTEWECPWIYFYGGTLPDGSRNDKIWRANIVRYTFAPKY